MCLTDEIRVRPAVFTSSRAIDLSAAIGRVMNRLMSRQIRPTTCVLVQSKRSAVCFNGLDGGKARCSGAHEGYVQPGVNLLSGAAYFR
jgi:hypothetical protein